MPTSKKIFNVQNLTEKFKQAKALVLADYTGLNVSQISELRREIKKAGGEFEVVKNSLLGLALKESKIATPKEGLSLTGPTATLWVYEENPAPLKTLAGFIQKNNLPQIKIGFWAKQWVSVERIQEIASLPGIEELRAKLVGSLKSPISSLAYCLNYNLWKLVVILKSKGGETNG